MSDNTPIFVDGVRVFKPSSEAPDWVVGNLVITLDDLYAWAKSNGKHVKDFNGKKQIRLSILKNKDESKGYYAKLDTYEPKNDQGSSDDSGLPF